MVSKQAKRTISIVMIMVLVGLLNVNIYAKNEHDPLTDGKNIKVADVDVVLYEDGRIKGIKQPEKLSQNQKKEILNVLNFKDEEIETFSDELQNVLLEEGGIKVDSVIEDLEHIYTDLDGVDHIITEENAEEIEEIKKRDYKRVKNKKGQVAALSTELNSYTNGAFKGTGIVTLLGTTSDGLEYRYKYRTTFNWSSRPALYYVDTIAQAWQTHTVSIATSGTYKYTHNNATYTVGLHDMDYSNVIGTKAKADIDYHEAVHFGWLEDEVRIPKNQEGLTGQFASAYGHAWSGFDISVAFKAVSVDLSGYGDKWSWKNSFKIGTENKVIP